MLHPQYFAVERAVLHGLGDVVALDDLARAVQIGDGARHLQDAGVGAVGQASAFRRRAPAAGARRSGHAGRRGPACARPAGRCSGSSPAVVAIAPLLKLPGGAARARGWPTDGSASVRSAQPLGGNGLHLDVHVDAVQQRAGDAVQIAPNLRGRAAALLRAAAADGRRGRGSWSRSA